MSAEAHFEQYLYLAEVTDRSALFTWGGFFFWISGQHPLDGQDWKLVDDDDLKKIFPPRRNTIGAGSEAHDRGKGARVEVRDAANGNLVAEGKAAGGNHCWVSGLAPNTEYTYKVFVAGKEWGAGELRDWAVDGAFKGLRKSGRRYDNRFWTRPAVDAPTNLIFAVLGDYGRGVHETTSEESRQREVAAALERAMNVGGAERVRLVLTTGDNVYNHSSDDAGGTGNEDDDWFFTFYQPYRYIINRVPVYPTCGNHDDGETEASDDRAQLYDNFYVNERFSGLQGLASINRGLFYRVKYGNNIEFICVDTSRRSKLATPYFEDHANLAFLNAAFPDSAANAPWRIPFCHHPPYCAGPLHSNDTHVQTKLVEPFCTRSGVRAFLSGHEHNFQYTKDKGIDFFITGGGGDVRLKTPQKFLEAKTEAWGTGGHFLIVKIDGNQMEIRPIGETADLPLKKPDGQKVDAPIVVTK